MKPLSPAYKTALRLLSEGDLQTAEFGIWTLRGEASGRKPGQRPADRRFISSSLVRKLLSEDLVVMKNETTIRLSKKGQKLHRQIQEQPSSQKTRTGPRNKRSMARGMTIFEFSHKGKRHTAVTKRDIVYQARVVQAEAWKLDPEKVPTISLETITLEGLTAQNVAKAFHDGLDTLVTSRTKRDIEPLAWLGRYSLYLPTSAQPEAAEETHPEAP